MWTGQPSAVLFLRQAVDVYLWDEKTQQPSSAISVPYSRLVNGSYEERDLHTTELVSRALSLLLASKLSSQA